MPGSDQNSNNTCQEKGSAKSALQDNIESKGKNAYYFAHAHKANGPKWDGKPQPRLLAKHSSSDVMKNDDSSPLTADNNATNVEQEAGGLQILSISDHSQSLIKGLKHGKSSFDFTKSNITKYAFLDEGKKVKIYIEMKGVGDLCNNEDDVQLDWNERSFSLKVFNYCVPSANDTMGEEEKKDVQCLSFGRLHGSISKAIVKVKKDRIILTLSKKTDEGEEPVEWPSIAQKGDDEHEIV